MEWLEEHWCPGLKDSAANLSISWAIPSLESFVIASVSLIYEASPLLVFVSSAGNISYYFGGLISQRTQCSYLVTYCAFSLAFELWYNLESLSLGMCLGF